MRIGIISYWNTQHNYGQVLQCYALQQFLKSIGHDSKHIKYVESHRSKFNQLKDLLGILLSGHLLSFMSLYYKAGKQSFMKDIMSEDSNFINRQFDDFRKDYISFTENEYTMDQLHNKPPLFDAYFCGSDQIWSSPTKQYMLQFGGKNVKRLSYAASLGGMVFHNKYQKYLIRKYLKSFDYISVREKDGVNELTRLGVPNVKNVLDPTFLLTKEHYNAIALKSEKKNYVFLYLLGNKIDVDVTSIYEWADSHNLEVIYATAQGRTDNFSKVYPSVNEWLGLIKDAKYVITNSFHGMAFSIIFEKKFMIIPLSAEYERMNGRVLCILDKFNLSSRCYNGNFNNIVSEIDYPSIKEQIANEKFHIIKDLNAILSHE